MRVGAGAYVDTLCVLDFDLVTLGARAVVGRNGFLFGHLGAQKQGKWLAYQRTCALGADSCLGSRAVAMPGYALADGAELAPLALGAPQGL